MKRGLHNVWRTITWPWRRYPKTVGGVTGLFALLCLVVVGSNAYILLSTSGEATDEVADAQDMLENVVDYHVIEKRIRAIIAEGHVRLAETLAERIAAACFADSRVKTARVRVEKLHALSNAESAGVEIERTR